MENIKIINDDQLRTRLMQFGFPNFPVTDTTRKVLVKKLQQAIEAQAMSEKKTKFRRSSRATSVKEKPSTSSRVYSVQYDSDGDLRQARTNWPTLGNSLTVRTSYETNVYDAVEETDSAEDSYGQKARVVGVRTRKPLSSATRRLIILDEPPDPGKKNYKKLRNTSPLTSTVYKSTQPAKFNYKFSAPPSASKQGTIGIKFCNTLQYVAVIILILFTIYIVFM